jgi:HECT-domain (ubiquitin-transferase)/Regulator of chromosome condensation (RCC1) repeat/SPRY domain/Kelch motif
MDSEQPVDVSSAALAETAEQDDRLLNFGADLFSPEVLAEFGTAPAGSSGSQKPSEFEAQTEHVGNLFERSDSTIASNDVRSSLQHDLATLAVDDAVASSFSRDVMEPRLHALKRLCDAMSRQLHRVRTRASNKRQALENKREALAPGLKPAAKLAIKTMVRTLLILMRSCQSHDSAIVCQILDLASRLVGELEPLSLQDGPNFSPDIQEGLVPLLDYVRSLVVASPAPGAMVSSTSSSSLLGKKKHKHSRDDSKSSVAMSVFAESEQAYAVNVLSGLALARGSLQELLSIVDVMLTNANRRGEQVPTFDVRSFLHTIATFNPPSALKSSMYIAIRTNSNNFITANSNQSLSCSQSDCEAQAKFCMERHGDAVAFKSIYSTYITCALNGSWTLENPSAGIGPAQLFEVVTAPNGNDVGFLSKARPFFLSSKNGTMCMSQHMQGPEIFSTRDPSGNNPVSILDDDSTCASSSSSVSSSADAGSSISVPAVPSRNVSTSNDTLAVPEPRRATSALMASPQEVISELKQRESKTKYAKEDTSLHSEIGMPPHLADVMLEFMSATPSGSSSTARSSVPADIVALIILRQLAVFSKPYAPQMDENLSGLMQGDDEDDDLPILSAPLAIDVKERSFVMLSSVIGQLSNRLFSGLPHKELTTAMRTVLYALRILKVHVHQLVRARLPESNFSTSAAKLPSLRKHVLSFLNRNIDEKMQLQGEDAINVQLIREECAQILAIGFEVFNPTYANQLSYFCALVSKKAGIPTGIAARSAGAGAPVPHPPKDRRESRRAADVYRNATPVARRRELFESMASGSPSPAVANTAPASSETAMLASNDVSPAESMLLSMLYGRFSTFATFADLLDELERNAADTAPVLNALGSTLLALCTMRTKMAVYDASIGQSSFITMDADHSAALQILSNLQQHLVTRAAQAVSSNTDSPVVEALFEYTQCCLSAAGEIAVAATEAISSNKTSEELRRVGEDVLHSSLVAELCVPLVGSLPLFAGAGSPAFSLRVLPLLRDFVRVLDKLQDAVKALGPDAKDLMLVRRHKTVESKHPYPNSQDREDLVSIAGAKSLEVHFDPRCATENDGDYCQLFEKPNKVSPLSDKLYGVGADGNWPTSPIIVDSNELVVHFFSDAHGADWGILVVVSGNVMVKPMAWVDDLVKSSIWLYGSLAKAVVTPSADWVSSSAKQHDATHPMVRKWLRSSMLSGGTMPNHSHGRLLDSFVVDIDSKVSLPKEKLGDKQAQAHNVLKALVHLDRKEIDAFVADQKGATLPREKYPLLVIENEAESNTLAAALVTKFKSLSANTVMLQPSIARIGNHIANVMFAVLLHHTHRAELALAVAQDKAEPNDKMMVIWKKANEIRVHMRTLKAQNGDIVAFLADAMDRARFLLEIAPGEACSPPAVSSADEKAVVARAASAFARVKSKTGLGAAVGNVAAAAAAAQKGSDSNLAIPRTSDAEDSGSDAELPRMTRAKSKWSQAKVMTKFLTNTMQALRELKELFNIRVRNANLKDDPEVKLSREILDFITAAPASVDFKALLNGVTQQRTRAAARLIGLGAFAQLAFALRGNEMLPEVLRHLAQAFRVQDNDTSSKSHFLDGLHAAGTIFRDSLTETYFGIVAQLIGAGVELDPVSSLLVLDVCNVDFVASDMAFLQRIGIVPFLSPLVAFVGTNRAVLQNAAAVEELKERAHLRKEPWNVKYGAWALFRLVTYISTGYSAPMVTDADESADSKSSDSPAALGKPLQQLMLETVLNQLSLIQQMREYEVSDHNDDAMLAASASMLAGSDSKMSLTSIDEAATEAGAEVVVPSDIWACGRCTFLNEATSVHCQLCRLSYLRSTVIGAQVVVTEMLEDSGLVLTYESDMDKNGLCYYLGTQRGTAPWENPMDLGLIEVTASTYKSDAAPIQSVVGRTAVRAVTEPQENSWFCIKFKDTEIAPTHYTLRHYATYDVEALRNWRFEASNDDGKTWTVLRHHVSDSALSTKGQTNTWPLPDAPSGTFFDTFRIWQDGQNSNGNHYLACSGFEIYGTVNDGSAGGSSIKSFDDIGSWLQLANQAGNTAYERSCLGSSLASIGKRMFAIGGDGTASTSAYAIDCSVANAAPRVEALPDLPSGRTGAACVAFGASVYVIGGIDAATNAATNAILRLDTTSNSWTEEFAASSAAHAPPALSGADAVIHAGTIFVVGGMQEDNSGLPAPVYAYSLAARSWVSVTQRGSEPPAVVGSNAGVYNGSLFRFGGRDSSDNLPTKLYEFQLDEFTAAPSGIWIEHDIDTTNADLPGCYNAAGVTHGRFFFVHGGALESKKLGDELHAVDLKTIATVKVDAKSGPSERSQHAMGFVNGTLYVVGGESDRGSCRDAYQLPIISEMETTSPWDQRSRHANLNDASVSWWRHEFKDVGLRGVPAMRTSYPTAAELDLYSNQFLWVLLRCCKSHAVRELLASHQWCSMLLSLTNRGSLITRILATRIVRLVLPYVSPDEQRAFDGLGSSTKLLELLLDRIGGIVLHTRGMMPHEDAVKLGIDSVASAPSFASESVWFYRSLLAADDARWVASANSIVSDYVNGEAIDTVLQALAANAIKNSSDPSAAAKWNTAELPGDVQQNLRRLIGSMCVLGGNIEGIHEGSRVLVSMNLEEVQGTVVCIERGKSVKYHVHLCTGEDVEISNLEELRASFDVGLEVSKLADGGAILDGLEHFLSQSIVSESMQQTTIDSCAVVVQALQRHALKALNVLLRNGNLNDTFAGRPAALKNLAQLAVSLTEPFDDMDFATEDNLESRLASLDALLAPSPAQSDGSPAATEFVYESDFDKNGILFHLGTAFGTSPWKNPMDRKLVTVTSNAYAVDKRAAPIAAVVGRDAVRCLTQKKPNSWFMIDLHGVQVRPTRYSLKHYSSWDIEALRSWNLEGKNEDEKEWTLLKRHENDTALNKRGATHTWDLPGLSRSFSQFRVFMTDKNDNKHWCLVNSGFELYGSAVFAPANVDSDDAVAPLDDDVKSSAPLGRSTSALSPTHSANSAERKTRRMLSKTSSNDSAMIVRPGEMHTFGQQANGVLGFNHNSPAKTPTLLATSFFGDSKVTSVSVFSTHVLTCTEQGKVFVWGNGTDGRLGTGSNAVCYSPTQVKDLDSEFVTKVAVGTSFSACLTKTGSVYAWGKNHEGQVGNNTTTSSSRPVLVQGLLQDVKIVDIGCGAFHTVTVGEDGNLYAWGRNLRGNIGDGTTIRRTSPVCLNKSKFNGSDIVAVVGGWDHSMAITSRGELYTWGNGYEGNRPATGHGHTNNVLVPTKVKALDDVVIVQASCGWDHCTAVTSLGHMYTWGGNPNGALGNGNTSHVSTPTRVLSALENERIVWSDGGQNHTVCVTDRGDMYSWGNAGAWLGHTLNPTNVPQLVPRTAKNTLFSTVHCGDKISIARECDVPRAVASTPMMQYRSSAGLMGDGKLPPYPSVAVLTGPASGFFDGFRVSDSDSDEEHIRKTLMRSDPSQLALADSGGFVFHPGKALPSDATRVKNFPELAGDTRSLIERALTLPSVKSFSTSGHMYSDIPDEAKWIDTDSGPTNNEGIFVRHTDLQVIPLKYLSTSGGVASSEYGPDKIVEDGKSFYCTNEKRNIDMLFEPAATDSNVVPTNVVIRVPNSTDCTHPLQTGAVFILNSKDDVKKTERFNSMTMEEYSAFMASEPSDDIILPVCFFDRGVVELHRSFACHLYVPGRIILLKMIGSDKDLTAAENIDVEFFGLYGAVNSLPDDFVTSLGKRNDYVKGRLAQMNAAREAGAVCNYASLAGANIFDEPTIALAHDGKGVALSGSGGIRISNSATPNVSTGLSVGFKVQAAEDGSHGSSKLVHVSASGSVDATSAGVTLSLEGLDAYSLVVRDGSASANLSFNAPDLTDNSWHHIGVRVTQEPAEATVLLDGEAVESVSLISLNVGAVVSKTNDITIAQGFSGAVCDIGVWYSSLEDVEFARACDGSFAYVTDDHATDRDHFQHLSHYDTTFSSADVADDSSIAVLPAGMELSAGGHSWMPDPTSAARSVLALDRFGILTVQRGVAAHGTDLINSYSVVFDVLYPALPSDNTTVLASSGGESNEPQSIVALRADGALGVGGKWGKKATRLRANKWNRVWLSVNLASKSLMLYVNGVRAIKLTASESLTLNGVFALGRTFYMFGCPVSEQDSDSKSADNDSSTVANAAEQGVYLRQVQIRDSKYMVKPAEMPNIGVLKHKLSVMSGRPQEEVANSLLKIGHRPSWVTKALEVCKFNRALANQWILANKQYLQELDAAADNSESAAALQRTGLPARLCVRALNAAMQSLTGGSTNVDSSDKPDAASVFSVAVDWLLQHNDPSSAEFQEAVQQEKDEQDQNADDDRTAEQIEAEQLAELLARADDESNAANPSSSSAVQSPNEVVFDSTSESMTSDIDAEVSSRARPERVVSFEFNSLSDIADADDKRIASLKECFRSEQALATVYARKSVLSFLRNWSNSATTGTSGSDSKQQHPMLVMEESSVGLSFIGRFLRLIDHCRVASGLDILREALETMMQAEAKYVGDAAAAPDFDATAFSDKRFKELAPVSVLLVQDVLVHLLLVLKNNGQTESAETEQTCVQQPNASLAVWVMTMFLQFTGKQDVSSNVFANHLFSPLTVKLLVDGVMLARGPDRLAFVRVLSKLVSSGVQLSVPSAKALKQLVMQMHTAQAPRRRFSPFFQTLVDLTMSLEPMLVRVAAEEKAAKLAAAPIEADAKGTPVAAVEAEEDSEDDDDDDAVDEIEFTYSSDFDENGILYWLGTSRGTKSEWQNPGELGLVTVTSAMLESTSEDANSAVGRTSVRCVCKPGMSNYFMFDFHGMQIRPTHYTLRHYSSWDVEALRNWEFQGSNDGETWTTLMEHNQDAALNGRGSSHTWALTKITSAYSVYRINMTGANSNSNWYLACSGFELYGTVLGESTVSGTAGVFDDDDDDVREFVPVDAEDTNGILYFIGTRNGQADWKNPVQENLVKVQMSSVNNTSQPPYAIVGRETVRCVTKDLPDQWFIVDLMDREVLPTHYMLRHYKSYDTEALRDWRFEGSDDGESWTVLREHSGDSSLNQKGKAHIFELPPQTRAFTMFRVYQTGPNSNSHGYLACSGFELYGKLVVPEDDDVAVVPDLYWDDVVGAKDAELSGDDPSKPNVYAMNQSHSSWRGIRSLQTFTDGQFAFEVEVTVSGQTGNTWKTVIGVVPESYTPTSGALCVGGSLGGHGYVQHTGCKYNSTGGCGSTAYGEKYGEGDVIRVVGDLDAKTLEFFKNGESQGVAFTNLEGPVRVGCSVTGQGTVLTLRPYVDEASKPKRKRKSKAGNPPWFADALELRSVFGHFGQQELMPIEFARSCWSKVRASTVEQDAADDDKSFTEFKLPADAGFEFSNSDIEQGLPKLYAMCALFSPAADHELVRLINERAEKDNSFKSMSAKELVPEKTRLTHYIAIENIDLRAINARFLVLQTLNSRVLAVLPMIDFSVPAHRSILTDAVRDSRGLLFWSMKSKLFTSSLASSHNGSSGFKVMIDRQAAVKLFEQRRTDFRGKRAIFSQLFRAMSDNSSELFRVGKDERAFKVSFIGEAGDDYGGLYRAALEAVSQELQSPVLPLFLECPNGREKVGLNRERFVPRPSSNSALYLSMYEFVGKLMGLAIRSGNFLVLDLPSMVWKPLVGAQVTEEDVKAIDTLSFKILEQVAELENNPNVTPEMFTDYLDLNFTTIGSDQQQHELVPGGADRRVTWEDRHEFARALKEYRIHEFDAQVDAIRRGLATVVPIRMLSLFTSSELEAAVSGKQTVDIELLRAVCQYDSCSESDPHIKFFWEVFADRFTDEERAKFLSFVWGRSRLPLTKNEFERPFKISRMYQADSNPDNYLPVAHTCFFSIDIPKYTSADVMYDKLLYAITHCVAIDADGTTDAMSNLAATTTIMDDDDDTVQQSLFT